MLTLGTFTHTLSILFSPYSTVELSIAFVLLLAAILLGNLLKRRIRNAHHAGFKTQFAEFTTPLIPPTLSIIFFGIAYGIAESNQHSVDTFLLFTRISVAWLAIRFVILMASRRTAGWFITIVIAPITLLELFGIWQPIADALNSISMSLGSINITAYHLLKGLVALIVLFWLAGLINNVVNHRIYSMQFVHYSHRTLIAKMFQILLYFIVFIIAMQMVGIDLTALSVFGGALGVGIGFGLQKIASNFISGIILLVERSIQVDDLVELADGTLGYIRKTGARYTLLETFDGKEILIPNEEFITQRLVSLTHSNTAARVEISVGVKYGTDLEQAMLIMKDAAIQHPRCISEPTKEPFTFISEFADSAINLNLFFWVKNVNEGRLKPKSDVMLEIDKRFKEANIEIPFPQRVLHLESQHSPITLRHDS